MKICVSAFGPTLRSRVQPSFGRCEYFVFFESNSRQFEAAPNPYAKAAEQAGVKSARWVMEKGATTVVTARTGEHARQILVAGGVAIVAPRGETVEEVLAAFGEPPALPEDPS